MSRCVQCAVSSLQPLVCWAVFVSMGARIILPTAQLTPLNRNRKPNTLHSYKKCSVPLALSINSNLLLLLYLFQLVSVLSLRVLCCNVAFRAHCLWLVFVQYWALVVTSFSRLHL